MKKYVIAAIVTSVLAGCNAKDAEDALSTGLNSSDARDAAGDILEATSILVDDILNKCNVSSNLSDCAMNYSPESLGDFEGNDADLKITTENSVITIYSDDSGKYFQYKPENLRISYSSRGSLEHALKIDISNYPDITVDFDAHIINNNGNFGSRATNLEYTINGKGFLSGTVEVSEDEFTCTYNEC